MDNIKYIHRENEHNLQAPEQIVPLLINLLHPKSVVDVGCGIGTFLHVFKKNGVETIKGYDGKWVNKQLLSKYIDLNEFEEVNLEKPIVTTRKYDLAICLEVAEHLDSTNASTIVQSLIGLSDVIIFSAAIPNQGGQNHVNEQWPDYWKNLFLQHDYVMLDLLRPVIWNNENIYWWYKQNAVVVVKKEFEKNILTIFGDKHDSHRILSYVHPEQFEHNNNIMFEALKQQELWNKACNGELPLRKYLSLIKQCLIHKLYINLRK